MVHRLSAEHQGVACRKRDVLGEAVAGLQVCAVSQGAIEILQFGGYSQVMVCGAEVQLRNRLAEDTQKGILQARRETK